MDTDPYNLKRFLDAQADCIQQVEQELRNGRKQSHWMWFIFPQMKGLGSSAMANHYGISSRKESQAFLLHKILGLRLRHCTSLVLRIEGKPVEQIFGNPDDLKFRSCMTLFANLDSKNSPFSEALQKYFGGKPDPLTIDLLNQER